MSTYLRISPKAYERQAKRSALDNRIKNTVGKILLTHGLNPGRHDLSNGYDQQTNFIILKSAIDRKVNEILNRNKGERHDLSKAELDNIETNFEYIVD